MYSKKITQILFALTLFISCFLLPTKKVDAQYPYTQKISYPESLPTPVIYDMITDKKGYVWLGTDRGLIKFNGIDFKIIEFDKTSLKSVSYLQEDDNGVIWCRNFYKEIFYIKNDSLHQFKLKEPITKDDFSFFGTVSSGKNLWICNKNKIIKLDIKTGETLLTFSTGKTENYNGLAFTDGKVFITTTNSNVWIIENDKFTKKTKENNLNFENSQFETLSVGKYFFTISKKQKNRKAFYYNALNQLKKLPLPSLDKNNVIFKLAKTGNNEYWICTQNGIWKWNPFSGKTELFIPSISATNIIKDYQGNYWISTLDDGLYFCPLLQNLYFSFADKTKSNNITRVAFSENKIAAGTSKGELVLLDSSGKFIFENSSTGNLEIEVLQYDPKFKKIFYDQGEWTSNNKVKEILDLGKRIAFDPWGNIIIALHNSTVIIGYKNGLPAINAPISENILYKEFILFNNHQERKIPVLNIRKTRSTYVLTDRRNEKFWISYEDDLYEYNYNGEIKILKMSDGSPIIGKHLFLQNDSTLLVSTSTNGLIILTNGKVVNHYSTKNGLQSDQIKKTIWAFNKYWLATGEGIEVIDSKNGKVTDFLSVNGLNKTIINDFEIKDSTIWLATHNGILKLSTNFIENNTTIKFPILNLKYNGISFPENSKLETKENTIEFEFEAIHFNGVSNLAYHYRLQNANDEWLTTNGFSKEIKFNSLPPGDYTFEIFASDINDLSKSELKTFHFSIKKPFWQKIWFISLVLFLVFILLFLLIKWRTGIIKKKLTDKEMLLQSRLMALRAQMNPHFIFNILNTVQGLIYSNLKKEAGNVLGNFSDLMRNTLIASEKQNISVFEEIKNLELYLQLEKARFEKDFEYSLNINGLSEQGYIIPSLLIQPFIENAIKHGLLHKRGIKKLNIDFIEETKLLKVVIDDNGIGRERSAEINNKNKSKPESFATKNINTRILINNELNKNKIKLTITDKTDAMGKATGTTIELIIPFMFT